MGHSASPAKKPSQTIGTKIKKYAERHNNF